MNEKKLGPVGVFDSGLGGVSVLKDLRRALPREDLLFRADSANAPYGTKSAREVLDLSRRSMEWLLERGCKEIVVACNTATAVGVETLRAEYPQLPIVGIEPALKPAALENPGGRVVLMATPLTLQLERVAHLSQRFENVAQVEFFPCGGLVELIEAGHLEDEALFDYLSGLFADLDRENLSAVVLGCTHYPHIRPALHRFFGPGVSLYDGGAGTARRARAILEERGLLREEGEGRVEMFNTDPSPRLADLARHLLNRE